MVQFAANSGRARWITSPILDERDWEALLFGEAARTDSLLLTALEKNISDLGETLQQDVRNALAWLVADEVLTFKLALPHNKLSNGEFHDKFGVLQIAMEIRLASTGLTMTVFRERAITSL
jgi:hypothetical protein